MPESQEPRPVRTISNYTYTEQKHEPLVGEINFEGKRKRNVEKEMKITRLTKCAIIWKKYEACYVC